MAIGLLVSNARVLALTNAVDAQSVPVTLTAEERDWIARHPVMRVGVLTNSAPFSYIGPDGKLIGIDIDLLNLVSQRTGLQFELVPFESAEAIAANWDQLDMLSSVAKSPLREKIADFTEEYSASPLVIVEREGEEVFGTGAALRRKTIALPRKHLSTQMITNRLTSVSVVLADTQAECFKMVEQGKADATIVNLFVASQYLNSNPHHKLTISGVLVKPQLPLRMAVHRDAEHALAISILNKGLSSVSQHELDEIFSRHLLFGLESSTRFSLAKRRAKQKLFAAIAATVFLLVWVWFLQKEIRARRKAEAQMRKANNSMEVFTHSLSHDLRAPLHGIIGFAQILKEDCYEKLNPEEQNYLDRIATSGSHMNKMITDVLAYSRATSSKWPMDTVELDPLVHQLIDGFPPEQRHYFQIDSKLPAVWGHATLLSQCIGNLLTNAVTYVPKERTPEVVIRADEEGSEVTISIEDNGIGIEPKDQKRIFQIFERAAPADYKGTGIGLAVVAKAAERMGGTVGVESQVGRGSRFWLRMPAANVQKAARQAKSSQPFWRRFLPVTGT